MKTTITIVTDSPELFRDALIDKSHELKQCKGEQGRENGTYIRSCGILLADAIARNQRKITISKS